jgi:hypothetical protein
MCVYDRPKFIVGLTIYGLDSDHTYPWALDKEDIIKNERIKNKKWSYKSKNDLFLVEQYFYAMSLGPHRDNLDH